MGRLTLELVERSSQSVNPAKQRELSLRGQHIEELENLGVTKDQYECIDFSDNQLLRIPHFPKLKRLRTLVFANNHIARIAPDAFENLPALESVVLTKNKLKTLGDLYPLAKVKNLERLVLRENDVVADKHYRSFILYVLRDTKIRFLDFERVTDKDKAAALQLFTEKPELLGEIAPARVSKDEQDDRNQSRLTPEQKLKYQRLIETADGDEVDFLTSAFEKGQDPPESVEALREAVKNQKAIKEGKFTGTGVAPMDIDGEDGEKLD